MIFYDIVPSSNMPPSHEATLVIGVIVLIMIVIIVAGVEIEFYGKQKKYLDDWAIELLEYSKALETRSQPLTLSV